MDLRDAKTSADAEIVARIELESIVQTKDDEINFLKNMYEEKIRQLMDINFDSEDWRTMFSNELALALRDIRAEYDAILESQKGADTDSWYKAKFNEMLATSQRSGSELVESKEEVKRARAKYQELQMEISRLRLGVVQSQPVALVQRVQLGLKQRHALEQLRVFSAETRDLHLELLIFGASSLHLFLGLDQLAAGTLRRRQHLVEFRLVPGIGVSPLLRFQDGVVFGADVSESQSQLVGEHRPPVLGVEVDVHQLADLLFVHVLEEVDFIVFGLDDGF